ncbi:MAG: asparagine synthase C-terminal domain-containing protein [Bacteroidia bacterium]|nr:asparagine synthase C-terminal domain-containing protein [Bacteroidia bacterium]
MEKARSSGVHVILGGQGSDEWNAGYAHHVFLHTAGQFWHHLADNLSYLFQSPIRYASTFAHVFYPKQIFLLKQRKRFDFIRKDVFDFSEFRDSLSADENLNESMMKDLTERRLPGFLRCEDRTSMHFGVESRPLFSDDKACMNLGMSMHPKQKVNGWHGKYLLKKALSGLVPEPVLWNKNKLAFSVPMYEWIKQNEKEILDYLKTSSDLIVRDKMPVGIDRDNYPYIARLYFFERWKKLFT